MIGTKIKDRYLLEAELGHGGMGVVYRARDLLLKRDVAVKVVSTSGLESEGRNRLLREAQAAAALNHQHIVSVYDVGQIDSTSADDSPAFIVMEFIDGRSLRGYKATSLKELLRIADQVYSGLAEAHQNGVIHRDLKPENIMVTIGEQGMVQIKLMDFGLARITDRTRLTEEDTFMGTIGYVAPEIIEGLPATAHTDLYALGVILYELAANRPPFEADSLAAVLSQHLYAPVVPPSTYNDQIPLAMDKLISDLLKKEPDKRPNSASQVQRTFEALLTGQITSPEPLSEPPGISRLARGRLVGREMELYQALKLWEQAKESMTPILLISGEPGVGKTRLARELAARIDLSEGRLFWTRCISDGMSPYLPIAQIIRTSLGEGDGHGLADPILVELLTLTPDLDHRFSHLPQRQDMDPELGKTRLFESMVALVNALCSEQAVAILIDDAHWVDSGTLALIRYLSRRLNDQPLLIIFTYRELELDNNPPFQSTLNDLVAEAKVEHIELGRLDRNGTHNLLATLFSTEIRSDFLNQIYAESEGNPFFVEQICQELVESGDLTFAEGRWQRRSHSELIIPQSIRAVLLSRINRLPEQTVDILRMAAVLGREFDFDTLLATSVADEDGIIAGLEMAEGAQLISEVRGKEVMKFAFDHGLIPVALTDEILSLRRRRLHRQAAVALELTHPDDYESLARHYRAAGQNQKAFRFFIRAAQRSLEIFANEEAKSNYTAALDLAGSEVDEAEALSGVGEAEAALGRHEEAIAAFRKAIALYLTLGNRDRVARLFGRASLSALGLGDTERQLSICLEGMNTVQEDPVSSGLAFLMRLLAYAYILMGQADQALPILHRSLAIAREIGDLKAQVQALSGYYRMPQMPSGEKLVRLQEAVRLAESADLIAEAAEAYNALGVLLAWEFGDLAGARKNYKEALKLAKRQGHPFSISFYAANIATYSISEGLLDNAESELIAARSSLAEIGFPESGTDYQAMSEAVLIYARGGFDEAIVALRNVAKDTRIDHNLTMLGFTSSWLGMALLEAGRAAEAEKPLLESLDIGRQGFLSGPGHPLTMLTVTSVHLNRLSEAEALLAQAERSTPPQTQWLIEKSRISWARAHVVAAGSTNSSERQEAWPIFQDATDRAQALREYMELNNMRLTFADFWSARWPAEETASSIALLEETKEDLIDMGAPGRAERADQLLSRLR